MAKYCFPAMVTKDDGGFNVTFPDLENCFTCGDTLTDAVDMADDVLAMMLTDMEDEGEQIPAPSDVRYLKSPEDGIIALVSVDTMAYRRRTSSKAVKKTLTIPQWLNEAAERKNVNFSQILQEALMEKLGVS